MQIKSTGFWHSTYLCGQLQWAVSSTVEAVEKVDPSGDSIGEWATVETSLTAC